MIFQGYCTHTVFLKERLARLKHPWGLVLRDCPATCDPVFFSLLCDGPVSELQALCSASPEILLHSLSSSFSWSHCSQSPKLVRLKDPELGRASQHLRPASWINWGSASCPTTQASSQEGLSHSCQTCSDTSESRSSSASALDLP